jgi:hypothetical protein
MFSHPNGMTESRMIFRASSTDTVKPLSFIIPPANNLRDPYFSTHLYHIRFWKGIRNIVISGKQFTYFVFNTYRPD